MYQRMILKGTSWAGTVINDKNDFPTPFDISNNTVRPLLLFFFVPCWFLSVCEFPEKWEGNREFISDCTYYVSTKLMGLKFYSWELKWFICISCSKFIYNTDHRYIWAVVGSWKPFLSYDKKMIYTNIYREYI